MNCSIGPVTCRPADLLEPEFDALQDELRKLAREKNIPLAAGDGEVDDVLTYALFPQIGLKFLENRGNPDAFEPPPGEDPPAAAPPASGSPAAGDSGVYTVTVNGQRYVVEVSEGGDVQKLEAAASAPAAQPAEAASASAEAVKAPLAGNIFKVNVAPGDSVDAGQVIVILEAMKMETEVRAPRAGTVAAVSVAAGDAVVVGDTLITLG